MIPILFADNFLAGAILTLVMPTLLLIVLAVWYTGLAKRVPTPHPRAAQKPPPEMVAAAEAETRAETPPPAAGS